MIALNSIDIPAKATTYITEILRTKRLTYGRYTRTFEQKFAKLHNNSYGIMVNSGTSALQIALHAAKIHYNWHDGDEILVPALTFVSDPNVILQNGLTPVFVDVTPDYFDIDPKQIKRHITPKTRAILVSHLFGQAAAMDEITRLAKKHRLVIIEDACEATFAQYNKKPVGSWGIITCFSTYAAHILTTGIGGIAITNSKALATIMRSLSFHGRDPSYTSIDDAAPPEKRFLFPYRGYSYRVSEMEAALGLAGLSTYKTRLAKRRKNALFLIRELSPLQSVLQLPAIRPGNTHSFMVFPIVVKNPTISLTRLVHSLENQGIETRYLLPLISQPCYKDLDIAQQYPVAQHLEKTGFYIGCHPDLTKKDLAYIVSTITSAIRNHG